MSRENVEVIRESVNRFNDSGVPAWDLMDPNVTFKTRGDLEPSSTYRGVKGFEDAVSRFGAVWDFVRWEIEDIVGEDDTYVAIFRWHLRGKGSGAEVETQEAWAIWMREGRFLRVEQYGSRREALEAAGLSE
jgi:ketosteroid isomerase-like protein